MTKSNSKNRIFLLYCPPSLNSFVSFIRTVVKDSSTFQLIETSDSKVAIKNLVLFRCGIVVNFLSDDLGIVNVPAFLKDAQPYLSKGKFLVYGFNLTLFGKVDKIFLSFGLRGTFQVPSNFPAFIAQVNSGIAQWNDGCEKLIDSPEVISERLSVLRSSAGIKKDKLRGKPKVNWQSAVEFAHDIQLSKGQWLIYLIGPSPTLGDWVLMPQKTGTTAKYDVWVWKPKKNSLEGFFGGTGFWYFRGKRPVFIWSASQWRFSGVAPLLGYSAASHWKFFRFRLNGIDLDIYKNSKTCRELLKEIYRKIKDTPFSVDTQEGSNWISEAKNNLKLNHSTQNKKILADSIEHESSSLKEQLSIEKPLQSEEFEEDFDINKITNSKVESNKEDTKEDFKFEDNFNPLSQGSSRKKVSAKINTKFESHSESNPDLDKGSALELDTGTELDSESDSELDLEAPPNPDPDLDTGTELDLESPPEPDLDSGPELASELDLEAPSDPELDLPPPPNLNAEMLSNIGDVLPSVENSLFAAESDMAKYLIDNPFEKIDIKILIRNKNLPGSMESSAKLIEYDERKIIIISDSLNFRVGDFLTVSFRIDQGIPKISIKIQAMVAQVRQLDPNRTIYQLSYDKDAKKELEPLDHFLDSFQDYITNFIKNANGKV